MNMLLWRYFKSNNGSFVVLIAGRRYRACRGYGGAYHLTRTSQDAPLTGEETAFSALPGDCQAEMIDQVCDSGLKCDLPAAANGFSVSNTVDTERRHT